MTLYPKSLIEEFSQEMLSNLLGNPHSSYTVSQLSTHRVEDVRLKALRFFKADPECFDLVFVANATAGMKLVMEAFRDNERGYWYGYHADSHTSLVGLREAASAGSTCFQSDQEVEEWLSNKLDLPAPYSEDSKYLGLFAYPAQSNMNGRRLPLSWPGQLRSSNHPQHANIFSLLDVAALVSTAQLDLSDSTTAPDFTVLSFYKIFGFPDLGALIVRKQSKEPLLSRKYFGGGTVQIVSCTKEQWHIKKQDSIHEFLEDGSLPIHNIIALDCALRVYSGLFGSIAFVSSHTSFLSQELYSRLSSLRHGNGQQVCRIYKASSSNYGDSLSQGPIIALNLQDYKGNYVSSSEIEKLALVQNIQFRVGGLCNPGGIQTSLDLAPWELKRNFSAGYRCGLENDIIRGKPTGVIRLSLGAMSNLKDITVFVKFVEEYFVEYQKFEPLTSQITSTYYIERLTIFPIKSCGSYEISAEWDVHAEGLAFDREWCVLRQGSNRVLSQKEYPKMALIKTRIDLENGFLHIKYYESKLKIPLSADPRQYKAQNRPRNCDNTTNLQIYASKEITNFFTNAIETPCALARHSTNISEPSTRHSKPHLQPHPTHPQNQNIPNPPPPTPLTNTSPILTITHSSLQNLNSTLKSTHSPPFPPSIFRANLLLAEHPQPSTLHPYAEDKWHYMRIDNPTPLNNSLYFEFLGGCRRCQMVCVDQSTAERGREPLSTLAKTRRIGGNVLFGVHTRVLGGWGGMRGGVGAGGMRVRVGARVVPFGEGEVGRDEGLMRLLGERERERGLEGG